MYSLLTCQTSLLGLYPQARIETVSGKSVWSPLSKDADYPQWADVGTLHKKESTSSSQLPPPRVDLLITNLWLSHKLEQTVKDHQVFEKASSVKSINQNKDRKQ